jgi:hypothetical protein
MSFVDERQVMTMIQPMLPLDECVDPTSVESATEPLHFVGDSATVEESAIEPLHSTTDPATAESAIDPLQFFADSDAAADAPTKTSCS